ncbi:hypothetical protein, partial [Vibrio parahaemolyticus]|uniref:hypothetical protein n=1 Tax=Vibrio parahaemolyticus TaxID=670 RepID=UPI001C604C99
KKSFKFVSDFIHVLGVLTELYIQREKTLRSLATQQRKKLSFTDSFDEIVSPMKCLTFPLM